MQVTKSSLSLGKHLNPVLSKVPFRGFLFNVVTNNGIKDIIIGYVILNYNLQIKNNVILLLFI